MTEHYLLKPEPSEYSFAKWAKDGESSSSLPQNDATYLAFLLLNAIF
jgi:hypothetical protein